MNGSDGSQVAPVGGFRVLGVDTSLRNTGFGVVERSRDNTLRSLWHHTVHVPAAKSLSQCLLQLKRELTACIDEYCPAAISIEGIFFCKFAKTAMLLGHARGVVIACAAEAGIPVYEYEPRRAKQAVTGYGNASKEQMQRMMTAMLRLDEIPPDDEGDALALAVCHLNSMTGASLASRDPV